MILKDGPRESTLEEIRRSRITKRSRDSRKLRKTGYAYGDMIKAIEDAKPASFITSNWRGGFGTNTIFSPGYFGISLRDTNSRY